MGYIRGEKKLVLRPVHRFLLIAWLPGKVGAGQDIAMDCER